jgi:flagellar hook assembly protein FlgD
MKKTLFTILLLLAASCVIFAGSKVSITTMDISPNPFSPNKGAGKTNIRYGITTDTGAHSVKTTIVIYNVAGKVVRNVLYNGLRYTEPEKNSVDSWDGKDDKGKMCMNGRYILRVEVEDALGKKQNLYSIMLAK